MPLPVPKHTRWRLGMLFSVPLAFSLVYFLVELQAERTDIRLLEIRNIQSSIAALQSLTTDADAGERGFLLTGDSRYIEQYQRASDVLPSQIKFCQAYAKDRPTLQPQIDGVIAAVQKRFAQTSEILKIQHSKGFAAALDLVKAGESQKTMDDLRKRTGRLVADLHREEDDYLEHAHSLTRGTFIFFVAGTLVMIVVLVWLYNRLLSYLYARDHAREQLEQFNADLQKTIDERTRELRESMRDLREANEELQQFAYVASHDLQEPLRTITSFSQLLVARYRGKLDEDADEFIGYIVTASRRMTDLINGLLQMVRVRKSGQASSPVSFEKLLEEAEVGLQAAIRENQARIEHGPLPTLVVNQVQFSQVVQNLILNAIKYRREEAPVIRIQARREGDQWIFSVSDNGQGFNQQFAERIFGIFQRLHGREVEGTGMGLSIARRIVERHGGRIWAESTEGVGSTFYFSVPASLETRQPAATETSAVAQAR